MTQLTDKIIAIELPLTYHLAFIKGNTLRFNVHDQVRRKIIQLPPGNWEIIGESDKMDEEGAKKVVAKGKYRGTIDGYPDYTASVSNFFITKAILSLHSLLRYHGIENNCLILKKVK